MYLRYLHLNFCYHSLGCGGLHTVTMEPIKSPKLLKKVIQNIRHLDSQTIVSNCSVAMSSQNSVSSFSTVLLTTPVIIEQTSY